MNDKLMRCLRRLSFVPRWQIFPTNRNQSVADHSFHVATITLWLIGFHPNRINGDFVLDALTYALLHEDDEAITGDVPSPSKQPKYDRPASEILVKVADGLEAYAFLIEEQTMGNGFVNAPLVDDVLNRTKHYYDRMSWDDHAHGDKPSWPNFLKRFRPTVMHPKWKHPVIEHMMEGQEDD